MTDDPFDDARPGFVRLEDLKGRLLCVYPQSSSERDSNLPGQQGKKYEQILADVIVLDGDVTEQVEEVPTILDGIAFSGSAIVPQLKSKLGKNRGVLGRLATRKSQTKGFGDAWVLDAPTDADKTLARPHAIAYQEKHADPFAA
jgi:hypothetical protein